MTRRREIILIPARVRRPSLRSQVKLLADGATKINFGATGKKESRNGLRYLVERFNGLAQTDPLRARPRPESPPRAGRRTTYSSRTRRGSRATSGSRPRAPISEFSPSSLRPPHDPVATRRRPRVRGARAEGRRRGRGRRAPRRPAPARPRRPVFPRLPSDTLVPRRRAPEPGVWNQPSIWPRLRSRPASTRETRDPTPRHRSTRAGSPSPWPARRGPTAAARAGSRAWSRGRGVR